MHYKIGLKSDGKIQAVKAEIRSDGGAYCFSTKGTVAKSAICGAGPYQIENVKVTATGYYTNNTPSGAMRTFGVLQPTFSVSLYKLLYQVPAVYVLPRRLSFR